MRLYTSNEFKPRNTRAVLNKQLSTRACCVCLVFAEGHRGFGFVDFISAEDAAAAVDNMVRACTTASNHARKPAHLATVPGYYR